jgi:hypothetical protein
MLTGPLCQLKKRLTLRSNLKVNKILFWWTFFVSKKIIREHPMSAMKSYKCSINIRQSFFWWTLQDEELINDVILPITYIQQGPAYRWNFFRWKPSPIRRISPLRRTSGEVRSDWSIQTRSRIYNLVKG